MWQYIPDIIWPVITSLSLFLVVLQLDRYRPRRVPTQETVTSFYLYKIARITRTSEYEVFRQAARDWPVTEPMIENDFKAYLHDHYVPHYVNDYIRKNRSHIDSIDIPMI